jgi:hypothetical protein
MISSNNLNAVRALGNGEVDSSILSGSTIPPKILSRSASPN